MRSIILFLVFSFCSAAVTHAADISGDLKKWHKVTLDFAGPATSETATPNPFTDYRLNVTFTHSASGKSYIVPGYFAADGSAANTSATSGNIWRVHFAPDETGAWTYAASFRSGPNIATSTATGSSAGFFDGDTGNFSIAPSDKTGRDFRGKGRLEYVGKHHLRFAETGEFFMKAGVDAPENFLAYADFDGGFKTDGQGDTYIKSWSPHAADWRTGDPVWQGTKGKGLIGAINYLAAEGLNAFSFLTMNINGDDKNVFPYTTYGERSRLDVSRMDQWEIVFEHGTRNGMHLNFKTQEIENQNLLDGGDLGNQRILYYRELIARFGHNLGLNWNLGEECTATTARKKAWAQYFHDSDPYRHPIVIHNTTSVLHRELMGDASKVTGFSLQLNASDFTDMFSMTKDYIDRSVAAGKPWVVACDEPGDAQYSLRPDSDPASSHVNARKNALWGNIMAGGAGVEWYFGYQLAHSDLTCNDFRSRDSFWPYCNYTLQFLKQNAVPFEQMKNQNPLISGNGNNANRCLAKSGDVYLVQLPSGGASSLNLAGTSGQFSVLWFNPRTGSTVGSVSINGGGTVSLGSPPDTTTQDWVVLVKRSTGGGSPSNFAPVVSAGADKSGQLTTSEISIALTGSTSDDGLPSSSNLSSSWTRVSGPAPVTFSNSGNPATNATFTQTGTYLLRLSASDGELTSFDEVTVIIAAPSGGGTNTSFSPTHDAYTQNGSNYNNGELKVENTSRIRISYLQFDLSSLQGAPSSATLRLREAIEPSGGTVTLRLFAANSNAWTESGLTGSNAPGKGAQIAVFTGDVPDGATVDFNLGSHIATPGIYSFILEIDQSSRDVSFASSENSDSSLRPLLLLGDTGGPPPNAAPIASAGADQSGTLTNGSIEIFLSGTANDDGLPEDSLLTVGWSVVSGPGTVVFSDPDNLKTSATFTAGGAYTLRLTASDGEKSASDNLTITIASSPPPPPSNETPVVSAGPNVTGVLSSGTTTVSLSGAASDDGLPANSTLALQWTTVSGPAVVSFASPSSASTGATFTAAGSYTLRLTATDGEKNASDDVGLTISAPATGGSQSSFVALHDTYLQNGTNYNNADLRVESTSRSRVVYLQFDLSPLSSPPSSALLRIVEGNDPSGGTMTLRVFAAQSNNWTESTINGGNAPAKGIELASFTGDISNGKVIEFDVAAFVTGPGVYSFIVQADASVRDVSFASAENSTVAGRPTLNITLPQTTTSTSRSSSSLVPSESLTQAGPELHLNPGGNLARLTLTGEAKAKYIVERSTDLIKWTVVDEPTADDAGNLVYVDPAPPKGQAFYRILQPQAAGPAE